MFISCTTYTEHEASAGFSATYNSAAILGFRLLDVRDIHSLSQFCTLWFYPLKNKDKWLCRSIEGMQSIACCSFMIMGLPPRFASRLAQLMRVPDRIHKIHDIL